MNHQLIIAADFINCCAQVPCYPCKKLKGPCLLYHANESAIMFILMYYNDQQYDLADKHIWDV
jgi:hypothetical protein